MTKSWKLYNVNNIILIFKMNNVTKLSLYFKINNNNERNINVSNNRE